MYYEFCYTIYELGNHYIYLGSATLHFPINDLVLSHVKSRGDLKPNITRTVKCCSPVLNTECFSWPTAFIYKIREAIYTYLFYLNGGL